MQKPPETLRIGVTGPLSRVQRFRIEDIPPITVELGQAGPGYFRFPEDLVPLPVGLKIAFARPEGFQLGFEATETRELPVRLELHGHPATGFRITTRRLSPATVRVSGPKALIRSSQLKLRTEPLSIEGAYATRVENLRIVAPLGVTGLDPSELEATIEIAPVTSESTLRGVPVRVEDPPGEAKPTLSPSTVAVRVEGPTAILATISHAKITARIRIGTARRAMVAPSIVGLPLGVRVVKVTPATVEVKLPALPP
jgi:YbbR domain-containing protein